MKELAEFIVLWRRSIKILMAALFCFSPLFSRAADDEALRAEVDRLRAVIAHHDELYFREAAPEITDFEYDLLKQELLSLEAGGGVAPRQELIGDDRSRYANLLSHDRPMLSLNKAYSDSEVARFFETTSRLAPLGRVRFSIEPKFDGVAVSVVMERGEFVSAATRGNGMTGEDISTQLEVIRSLHYEWGFDPDRPRIERIELRGEIFLSNDRFASLNAERAAAGKARFRHPRSVAAGTVKLIDLDEVASRGLSIVFHGWGSIEPREAAPSSVMEFQRWLEGHGFPAVRHARFVTPENAGELNEAANALHRSISGYPTDGIVIKVDSVEAQEILGNGPTAPRWSLARKFSPARAETVLRDIVWQVGRTGVLTPVAEFDPVILGGATVRRASLSNGSEIMRQDLRLGDSVWVERAGEIIPRISGILLGRREAASLVYELPSSCPACAGILQTSGEVHQLICENFWCEKQVSQRLLHFVSKHAMQIRGIGPVMADRLVASGLVRCPSDLYKLTVAQLVALPGIGEKTAQGLVENIDASRMGSTQSWIVALGLPGVGPRGAKTLAGEIRNLADLLNEGSCRDAFQVLDAGAAERLKTYLSRPEVRGILIRLTRVSTGAAQVAVEPRG